MHALQQALHYQWAGVEEWTFTLGEGKQRITASVGDWHDVHDLMTQQFNLLFDEEKEELGDLPSECERLFKSYLRFWADDQDRYSVVILPKGQPAIEFVVETPLRPLGLSGDSFKGRIDLLVHDEEYGGEWVWDAKWVGKIPAPDERMMSPQALLYVWGLRRKYKLDVRGFLFNYGRTKPPSIPRVLKRPAGMLSTAHKLDTDYATYLRAIKENHGAHWKSYIPYYMPKLKELQGREALWFDRGRIPIEDEKILRAVREYVATVRDIQRREERREYVPRSYFFNCRQTCPYHDPCVAEFQGLEIENLIKQTMHFEGERYGEENLLSA